jgi:hypothetical protein
VAHRAKVIETKDDLERVVVDTTAIEDLRRWFNANEVLRQASLPAHRSF